MTPNNPSVLSRRATPDSESQRKYEESLKSRTAPATPLTVRAEESPYEVKMQHVVNLSEVLLKRINDLTDALAPILGDHKPEECTPPVGPEKEPNAPLLKELQQLEGRLYQANLRIDELVNRSVL